MRKTPHYTSDWVSTRLGDWLPHVGHLVGRPMSYLEIGVHEGRSAIWVAQHIATHAQSRLTLVDDWSYGEEKVYERCLKNLDAAGIRHKCTVVRNSSYAALAHATGKWDLVYIDGDHRAAGVLADGVVVWHLTRPDSVIVFDDYEYRQLVSEGINDGPGPAIDALLHAWRHQVDVLRIGWQVILRRR